MKINTSTKAALAALASAGLAASADAQINISTGTVGASTSFSASSLSGANGSLVFQSVLASPVGTTIQGGSSQGPVTGGTGWGEVFNYSGVAATLGAISIITTGNGGTGTYQAFLFNLGPTLFNTPSSTFNPSTQANLLATQTIQPGGHGSSTFLEFDFSGADAVTLVSGDSYAFGLVNNGGTSDLNYLRSGGGSGDPNGDGFTLASLGATTDNASPYSGSVRTSFIGVYTLSSSPEPTTMALMGLGLAVGVMIRRRKVA
jgi:hypothetical protein